MDQPPHAALETPLVRTAAAVLFVAGSVLVATSMWALGVTGTYLGDYFGILMDEMVTGFPFNVVADPMYVGSTLNFVAVALWYARPAGLALSVLVWLTYRAALAYEGYADDTHAARSRPRSTARPPSAATPRRRRRCLPPPPRRCRGPPWPPTARRACARASRHARRPTRSGPIDRGS